MVVLLLAKQVFVGSIPIFRSKQNTLPTPLYNANNSAVFISMTRDITPKQLVTDQIDKYNAWQLLSSMDRPGKYRSGAIGETIRRMTPEELEKLKLLTSDDLKNVRHPHAAYGDPKKPGTRVFRIPHEKT